MVMMMMMMMMLMIIISISIIIKGSTYYTFFYGMMFSCKSNCLKCEGDVNDLEGWCFSLPTRVYLFRTS